jgi:hypothetical protein
MGTGVGMISAALASEGSFLHMQLPEMMSVYPFNLSRFGFIARLSRLC